MQRRSRAWPILPPCCGADSTLTARKAAARRRATRLDQLVAWAGGAAFNGCLLLDECHRAKNFCPAGGGGGGKGGGSGSGGNGGGGGASLSGRAVVELQERLPNARVVYCSATGATEPRNLVSAVCAVRALWCA
jgi:P-loop containing NTP hydrolase pore-1